MKSSKPPLPRISNHNSRQFSSGASFVDIPSSAADSWRSRKRWRLANVVICSTCALRSLTKGTASRPATALDMPPDIDADGLKKIVKDRDSNLLLQKGGVDGVVSTVITEPDIGIRSDDVERRRQTYGSNTYKKPPPKGFFHFVWEALKDVTIIILMVCAILSLGFGIKENGINDGWYDGGSILFAVCLVIVVSAVTNFRQSRQFEELSKVSSNIQINVIRDGRRQHISIFDIVVGDIVTLKIGDQVPADGLLLAGHSLQVDESSLTGESDYVEVDEVNNPFLLSGSKVANGYSRMVVTAVGMNTGWGEMMSSITQNLVVETPLQARLNKLTSSIGKIGLVVAFLVLLVLLIRYFTGHTEDEKGMKEFNGKKTSIDSIMDEMVQIVAAAVTIIVVAIPEGLPLAVTLTLAYSMKRMMADQALVRKLSSCETMGSATVICTDKTGTLTMNKMTVTEFKLGKDNILSGNILDAVNSNVIELLRQGVGLNTAGSVFKSSSGELEFSGSPTEKAILLWAVQELKMDIDDLTRNYDILNVETFNSEKKRSGVLIRCNSHTSNKFFHFHLKGAAEIILGMCSSYYDKFGQIQGLDEKSRDEINQIIKAMAARALRCIAFAHKEINQPDHRTIDEQDMILLSIVGLKDPCRVEVKKAVEKCRKAGVQVKMITGDNIFTAKAIAIECGILESDQSIISNGEVIEGVEFRNYNIEERTQRVENIRIMARSSPLDKLLMVRCLKQKGHVVAVTGDGTNDAPALKEADVGLSMGIQGTEVAKESSDIIILDDNFSSVVTVLKWGRCVYNNIQKFIQFQLTVNVAALVINLVAACSSGQVPLTAVQLLWVNLIMDTLGALALATERPTDELMDKPPVGRTEPLITNIMYRNLLSQAAYQIIILLTLQFCGESLFGVGVKVKNTMIFNTFVLCQVFNEFNARRMERKNVFKGILENKLFLWIISFTVALQVVMVEFLQKFANTQRLNWLLWIICVELAALSWPIGWIVKCVPVGEKPLLSYLRCNLFKRSG